MDIFETIYKRRSVRRYTGESIAPENLLKIVDAGRWAASGNNRQPWEFIIVTQRQTIDRLKVASHWMDQAAAIIAVVMDPSSRWWMEDASAAVENMLLAATALGYGACWLEGYTLQREDELKIVLGIPPGKRLFTLLPIGVPAEWPVKEKKPLDNLVYWECYTGQPADVEGDATP
jgi:nitroreductase